MWTGPYTCPYVGHLLGILIATSSLECCKYPTVGPADLNKNTTVGLVKDN